MPEQHDLRVTWLGHSTVLLELQGQRIITDPFLRDRLGPLRRAGPLPDIEALGPIDVVLISHAHPDHFDRRSLRRLAGNPLVIVPTGLGRTIAALGLRAHELSVGDRLEIGATSVTALPAHHGRWPRHPYAATIGYLIDGPPRIYFAGDTSRFADLIDLVRGVDVALLPIGSWGPHRAPWHLGPIGAARLAADIGAKAVIPIHWGTLYPGGLDRVWPSALQRPATAFGLASAQLAKEVDIRVLQPGDTTIFADGDATAG